MQIADLNHLETVEANVTGGFFSKVKTFSKGITKIKFDLDSRIDLKVDGSAKGVYGNTAQVESDAAAYGNNTVALVGTYTLTTPGSSIAQGLSVSGTN